MIVLVAGASRHAKEILDVLYSQNQLDDLKFFDDISVDGPALFCEQFPIVTSIDALADIFNRDNRFILGLGGTRSRELVSAKLRKAGGVLQSIVASSARIGHFNVNIGAGVNIMEFVLISSSVVIGEGSLINAYAAIHHDVSVGAYCEVSPRATLLGGAVIGDRTTVGSGATILPNLSIGNDVIIGAGSVVTRNIPENCTVVGVPGRIIKENPSRIS